MLKISKKKEKSKEFISERTYNVIKMENKVSKHNDILNKKQDDTRPLKKLTIVQGNVAVVALVS